MKKLSRDFDKVSYVKGIWGNKSVPETADESGCIITLDVSPNNTTLGSYRNIT